MLSLTRFGAAGVSRFLRDWGWSLALLPWCLAAAAVGCSRAVADEQVQRAPLGAVGFGEVAWEQYELPTTNLPPPGHDLAALTQRLPLLAKHGLALVLHWPSTELQQQARWDLVRSATELGIAVRPWITLPDAGADGAEPSSPNYAATGYFPNATNADAWCAAARELMESWQSRGLAPTTLVVDFEMRRERLIEFAALSSAADVAGVLSLLQRNRDAIGVEGFARAKQTYADFVAAAHQRGFRVTVSTLLPLLDDFELTQDADDLLRQGFQVPLDPSTAWDSISFQVQRTLYQSYAPTAYFVYHYARQARALFGARAAINLGVTDPGWAVDTPAYASGAELRQDVEAALAAGIAAPDIGVYSFYGMYKTDASGPRDPSQWLQPPTRRPPGWAPPPDIATPIIQTLQRMLRSALAL